MSEHEREGWLQGEVEHVIVCACVRVSGCMRVCVHVHVQVECACLRAHFALPLAF